MKTYKVYFKQIVRPKNYFNTEIKVLKEETVQANSFREARQIIREKYNNKVSNIITEEL